MLAVPTSTNPSAAWEVAAKRRILNVSKSRVSDSSKGCVSDSG